MFKIARALKLYVGALEVILIQKFFLMASRGRSSDFKGNSDGVEIYEEKVPQFT